MTIALSANTQAILLLTAPLIVGRGSANADLLSPGAYKRLARHLRDRQADPAALIAPDAADLIASCAALVDLDRLARLLGRGLQLSQAVERWLTRGIWVVSRADAEYPLRLKAALRGDSPAVLYGCGDAGLLDGGGLAVVGSRHVDEALVAYAMDVGGLAADAGEAVVSGGAKGIDQAAMRGALAAGGRVCGVLADSLERQVMVREHRDMIVDGRLVLVSPYDPNAPFNVGHAMQRNKSIYALADAALVASSDLDKGGTWAGAVEQLGRLNARPVYVRSTGEPMAGLDALRRKGARPWPNPRDANGLRACLADVGAARDRSELMLGEQAAAESRPGEAGQSGQPASPVVMETPDGSATPADTLFAAVQQAIEALLLAPMNEGEVAAALDVSPAQAKAWLHRLVEGGALEKRQRPARYARRTPPLFV